MEKYQAFMLILLHFSCTCCCCEMIPMSCNVSLTNSCSATLYYAPKQPTSAEEAAGLFRVPSAAVSKTADGFLITVDCACRADHKEYTWHGGYTIQDGDTWDLLSEKFGLLLAKRPEKLLIPGMNVSLDIMCGCLEDLKVVTYNIQQGDTLFTICSRFRVDMLRIASLNMIADPSLIHTGDNIFIPATGLDNLIDANDFNAKRSSGSHSGRVLVVVIPSTTVILVVIAILIWIYHKRKLNAKVFLRGNRNLQVSSTSCACKMGSVLDFHSLCSGSFKSAKTTIFPYYEIYDATSKLSPSHKIGQGSYGCVYLGRMREVDVAIKQMKNTKSKEFFAELNILCKVSHDNLIKLLGYSAGAESLFLVYEYAQNGALSDHLHNPAIKGHKPLAWSKRVHIALDAAKGLEYIHMHIKPFYVHRDVKTSNILLDSKFGAKIADFGLVKLLGHSPEIVAATSKLVGTFGYLSPEYVRDGYVTPKSDVYAYGVVLMELITGQPALSRNGNEGDEFVEHRSVVDYVLSALEGTHGTMHHLREIVDPNLYHYNKDSLLEMALLSKECVDDDWKRRPDMSAVVLRLSEIAQATEQDEIRCPPATNNIFTAMK